MNKLEEQNVKEQAKDKIIKRYQQKEEKWADHENQMNSLKLSIDEANEENSQLKQKLIEKDQAFEIQKQDNNK